MLAHLFSSPERPTSGLKQEFHDVPAVVVVGRPARPWSGRRLDSDVSSCSFTDVMPTRVPRPHIAFSPPLSLSLSLPTTLTTTPLTIHAKLDAPQSPTLARPAAPLAACVQRIGFVHRCKNVQMKIKTVKKRKSDKNI